MPPPLVTGSGDPKGAEDSRAAELRSPAGRAGSQAGEAVRIPAAAQTPAAGQNPYRIRAAGQNPAAAQTQRTARTRRTARTPAPAAQSQAAQNHPAVHPAAQNRTIAQSPRSWNSVRTPAHPAPGRGSDHRASRAERLREHCRQPRPRRPCPLRRLGPSSGQRRTPTLCTFAARCTSGCPCLRPCWRRRRCRRRSAAPGCRRRSPHRPRAKRAKSTSARSAWWPRSGREQARPAFQNLTGQSRPAGREQAGQNQVGQRLTGQSQAGRRPAG